MSLEGLSSSHLSISIYLVLPEQSTFASLQFLLDDTHPNGEGPHDSAHSCSALGRALATDARSTTPLQLKPLDPKSVTRSPYETLSPKPRP